MSDSDDGTGREAVNAEPTKDFFISMLVRDIGLIPAIVDLVDNSVDGARRLRPVASDQPRPSERFKDLWVTVRAQPDGFEIRDNCGGIPWQVARDYAFRFGRPSDAPDTPNSIGQFGIGMKRALFKLGTRFSVESATADEHFQLEVNVDEWRQSDRWNFPNATHQPTPRDDGQVGTDIEVQDLHDSVREEFSRQHFQTELGEVLSRIHQSSMSHGLAINLNGIPVDVDVLTLLQSGELKPARLSLTLDEDTDKPVHVEIYAGIEASSPAEAGWYIYCNGRLILGPDRAMTTGWGEGAGKTIPQYHNQFARFRGYVFFESADVAKLPWKTTKEGVDEGHHMYRAVRPRMIALMRPVINFLNALDAEKDRPEAGKESLESIVAAAEQTPRSPLTSLSLSDHFVTPERPPAPKRPETQSIQYTRPKDRINAVKKKLKVSSARQVGEGTFDYFWERECEDDD